MSFADQGRWQLDGGARSLGEVLGHVTGLAIRAEFLIGDAESGLARLELMTGGTAAGGPDLSPGANGTIVAADDGWSTYVNDRFGTTIDYPASQFTPMAPPANGDGRTFRSSDGQAQFFVFGQYNALGLGFAELIAYDKAHGGYDAVTYQRKGTGWYVLSGYKGRDIFYRKVLVQEGGELLSVFEITYPGSQKTAFDPIVSRMAASMGPKR